VKKYLSILSILLLFSTIVFMACSDSNPVNSDSPGEKGLPRSLSKGEEDVIAADNTFGYKIFNEIITYEGNTNVFVSPFSIAQALGMTYNGAKGETQEAMQNTLELQNLTVVEVNQAYKSLVEFLLSLDSKVRLNIANSIWYTEGMHVEQPFINVNKTFFNAEVASLDFSAPESKDIINNWVNTNTNGKIKEIIKQIDPLVVMYLINAFYFKGTWTYEFEPENTKDDMFNLRDGTQKTCKMMEIEGSFMYRETSDFQAIDLPYNDGDFSMTVILPKEGKRVDDVISSFNVETWEQLTGSFTETDVNLFLPKFKLKYEIELSDVLKALGMGIAFGGAADFSGINGTRSLHIDKVIHKTYVDVNEEGTEAAAVTAVVMRESTADNMALEMRVDRPFTFVIRETNSGAILFMGKIIEPALH